jgi:isopropylmalate/homocitrate/citramalate synthase
MCQRYPELQFDFHPHNDYGLATANVMAAVRAGVSSIHCTVNCLGERAGNASLAEVAVVLRDKKVSTSYVQRRLQIGYNKAASLIERMEREGLISAANATGKREILVPGDSARV